MINARITTIVASWITILGGSVAVSEAKAVRAGEAACTYGYAAFCSFELCPVGWDRTCSQPCTMPECEDIIAYSCCQGGN